MRTEDNEYELMPREELDYLRREVEKLKRNPLGDTQASISLLDSLNSLNDNIAKLNNILEGANDDMVKSFNETSFQEQLRKMNEQQEKLARGIVAIAELVKDLDKKVNSPAPTLDNYQFIAPKPQMIPPQPQAAAPVQKSPNPFDEHQQYLDLNGNPTMQGQDISVPLPPPRRY